MLSLSLCARKQEDLCFNLNPQARLLLLLTLIGKHELHLLALTGS